jgi:hypothetical protein
MSDIKNGDKVSWNSPGGETEGTVTKKITSGETIAGHTAKATSSSPQYKVKSAKSGKNAIHKPESLTGK